MTHRGNPIRGLPLFVLLIVSPVVACSSPPPSTPVCAIDMGSNSFRRIVGIFADGHYREFRIDSKTMGVGDDVQRHGMISEGKLAEVSETLSQFAAACAKDGAPLPLAVGTAAFRDAPNAVELIAHAALAGIRMEIASEERESELAYLVASLGRDGFAVIDNGSRSIELVAKPGGTLQHRVFNLGYRIAYEQYFAKADDPAAAIALFRDRLLREAAAAPFMKGQSTLAGVEFMEMADVLFTSVKDGHVFTLAELKARLDAIGAAPAEFAALKKKTDIDRALPRLVVAVTMMEAFGYNEIQLTSRQLGAGLIIEAGMRR
jgi:exopolyphosphatase/pppGpp-phosphohydrolase